MARKLRTCENGSRRCKYTGSCQKKGKKIKKTVEGVQKAQGDVTTGLAMM
jgi:hypothetical protein